VIPLFVCDAAGCQATAGKSDFFQAAASSDPRRRVPQAALGTRLLLLGCGQQQSTNYYAFRRAFLPIFHSQLLFGCDLTPSELSFGLCCASRFRAWCVCFCKSP